MRYIDADELIEFFDGYPDHIEFDVEDIKSIIKEQDTADVVEVVRCKDCKYWQDNNGGYPNQNCRWMKDETPDDDDYRSYAEERADE